jgi:hypothetical protein
MISDPFRTIAINMYTEHNRSTLKNKEHWKYKKIHCPVCDCEIVYPRSYEHIYTRKHNKNLKKKLSQNAVNVFD